MTVPGNIDALLLGGQRGYQIERSLRFNSADSAYLNRTPASAGNRKTWTWSGWVKRSKLGVETVLFHAYDGSSSRRAQFLFNTSDQFVMNQGGGGTSAIGNTTAVFRDVSAWYHFVFYADYANTTFKLYVNNVEQTLSYSSSVINADGQINAAIAHQIGSVGGSSAYFDGYLTEIHFIDGQALTPSSFGETDTITGVWKPKKYAGTYGTNGFYLKFADNSGTTSTTLGKDSSGNGNNWTPNNFSVTAGSGNDSLIDTPTPYADGGNGRGNYCTMNPLNLGSSYLSDGNLKHTGSGWGSTSGTMAVSTGKWYWEVTCDTYGGSNYTVLGIVSSTRTLGAIEPNTLSDAYVYSNNGYKYNNNTGLAYGATYTTGDVIGVALDIGAGTVTFYKNGTSQGTAYSGLSGAFAPCLGCFTGGVLVANFGQRPFAYTPPSGFKALNTQNLPEPSIKKPSSYFDAKLYTGNGSTQTISGIDFSPDLVWIKSRSAATNNDVFDSVRGATVGLATNSTQAESTFSGVTAFNSNGFSLGSNTSDNANSATYVAWCWDESATPGFDIVTYTGNETNRTIAHSLGVAPSFLIAKVRDYSPESWFVWHSAFPGTDFVKLDSTDAKGTSASLWNSTVPTSSVFSLGTSAAANRNGKLFVAYLWSEVAGFSKFGSYTGNGSSDGPFVFCGFRPRWVMMKRTDTTGSWIMWDTARNTYNQAQNYLLANASDAEANNGGGAGSWNTDILSNGFKVRSDSAALQINASGGTYIFAAFAESAFKYSLAR